MRTNRKLLIAVCATILLLMVVLCSRRNTSKLAEAVDSIVIINIDQATINTLGGNWPVPRAIHAEAIEKLAQAGSKVILYNLILAAPSVFGKEDDQTLISALEKSGNIVLPAMSGVEIMLGQQMPNIKLGDGDITRDRNGTIRSISTLAKTSERPTCAALAAGQALGMPEKDLPILSVRLRQPPRPFPSISFAAFLKLTESERKALVGGKIVIVGLDSTQFHTQVRTAWSDKTPGNVAQGAAVASILAELRRRDQHYCPIK